jgi:hypothetical protein
MYFGATPDNFVFYGRLNTLPFNTPLPQKGSYTGAIPYKIHLYNTLLTIL